VQALQQTLSGAVWLFNLMLLIIMTPMVAFYLLMDWPVIMKECLNQLPKKWRVDVKSTASDIDDKLAAYLRGTLSVCLTMGGFYALTLTAIGPTASFMTGNSIESLELGWAIGIMAGFLAFLPVIGASVGLFTMLAVALVQYQLQVWEPYALIVGIFFLGQALEGYVLTPWMVGNRVGLHPLWVIFSLLSGGVLGGVLGMLAAVPVAVIISVLLPKVLKWWRDSVG
jgi:predicted PurR-regulated permease PerM